MSYTIVSNHFRKDRPKALDAISPLTPGTPQSLVQLAKQISPQTPASNFTRGLTSTPDFDRSHKSIKVTFICIFESIYFEIHIYFMYLDIREHIVFCNENDV